MVEHNIGDLVYNINSLGVIINIYPEAKRRYLVRWLAPVIEHESRFAYDDVDILMFKKLLEIEIGAR